LARRLPLDVVVLHTTVLTLRWDRLFPRFRWRTRWIGELDCAKIAMPQDEYDHSEILDEWLYELGVTTIVSNFGPELHELLYPLNSGRCEIQKRLTGYVDERSARALAARIVPLGQRRADIVYRATRLPYWFG